jgi:fatty-acyl-CoA synthase
MTDFTVYDLLVRSAEQWPDSPAVIDDSELGGGVVITYSGLLAAADTMAGGLAGLGIGRGDAVALFLPNCHHWPTIFFAAAKLGALVVPLNTRYRANEIYHLLRTSKSRVLITAPTFEGIDFGTRLDEVWTLHSASPGDLALQWFVTIGGGVVGPLPGNVRSVGLESLTALTDSVESAARSSDPLIVFGTSGTTSAPKLAVHTHSTVALHAPAVAERENLGPDTVQLNVLALNGTFGFVPFVAGIAAGSTAVLLPAFDQKRIVGAIAEHGVSYLVSAEGPLRDLLAEATFRALEPRTLTCIVTAGTAISDIVEESATLGITASNVYGSSELFAFAGKCSPADDETSRTRPGGTLVDESMQVRTVSVEDSSVVLGSGEWGELQFTGDTLFVEYLANPDATAKAWTSDGWFRTGDLGSVHADGKSFEYRSRLGDSMRLKGYLVNPADIESTLTRYPATAIAQVVSVRDHRSGDDLAVAFVRLHEGMEATEGELLAHCKANLASFKIPNKIRIIDNFPTTASANGDKIRKDKLRAQAAWLLDIPAPVN